MFQYTREVILNDKVVKEEKKGENLIAIQIDHVGTYKKGFVPHALIVEGVESGVAELAVPAPTTTLFPKDLVGRYIVKIGLQSGEVDALLANYTTWFKRDIIVEIPANATAEKVKECFTLAFTGLEEFPLWYNAKTNKIIAKTPYVTLQIETEKFEPRTGSPVITEGIWKNTSTTDKVKGVRGFGTYDLLVKNHRLPTMENIRPWGEAIEEYPIRGTLYSMVELTYVADRNIGGFGVLGQKATSVTKHRFWIPATETAKIASLASIADVIEKAPVTPASVKA